MNWFRKFMVGRYGGDQLSFVLLLISVILTLISSFTDIVYFGYASYIPLILAFYRMFSKNIYKRRKENERLIRLYQPLKIRINKQRARLKDKNHRYYVCKSCKTILRVPKGKGKITITCPKCKHQLTKKT